MPWENVLSIEVKQRFVNLMESGHFLTGLVVNN